MRNRCGLCPMPYSVEGLGLSGEASLPRFGRISCAESLRLMPDAVFCRRAWTDREASLPRFGRISCAESLRLMSDAVFCRRNWTVWSRVRPDFAGRFSAFTLYAAHDIDKRKHRPRPALVRRKDEFRFPFRFGTGHGESEGRYIRLMRATGEMSIGANSPR